MRKWTLPSANRKLQPPGWLLLLFWYGASEVFVLVDPAIGTRRKLILLRIWWYDRVEQGKASVVLRPPKPLIVGIDTALVLERNLAGLKVGDDGRTVHVDVRERPAAGTCLRDHRAIPPLDALH